MASVKKIGLASELSLPTRDQLRAAKTASELRPQVASAWSSVRYAERNLKEAQQRLEAFRTSKNAMARVADTKVAYEAASQRAQSLQSRLESLERLAKVAIYMTDIDPDKVREEMQKALALSQDEPVRLDFLKRPSQWVYKDTLYSTADVRGRYTEEQLKLLVFEAHDKERRRWERLRQRFETAKAEGASLKRPRIPEQVRIQVWHRDGGKCARCGSRENLEYDHIVPVSKGGSNTVRNIELLCEECNRKKADSIG